MSTSAVIPEPRPLKRRCGALVTLLVIYFAWVGFLAWVYFSQATLFRPE